MRKHRPLPQQQFADAPLEEMRRSMVEAITMLQRDADDKASTILPSVALPDATRVTVAHKLGRVPRFVTTSIPRGAVTGGVINEVRDSATDRTKFLILQADDFGATITVDIEVR